MRLTPEQKAVIFRLKRSGLGYGRIASATGIKHTTVRAVCKRSGLFDDNPAHAALFTIPEQKYSTELATVKPLPQQKVVTGHKQTDAYLWVLEVIKLNEPAHLPAAEAALSKLTIDPKDAEKRYRDWMMLNGADMLNMVFGTLFMDDPQHFIRRAKENIASASQVRAHYGSYDAAMKPVAAELLIDQSVLLVGDNFGMTEDEAASGTIYGHERYFEVEDARSEAHNGFCDVLPDPHTLSDVVREFEYWNWLYHMRNTASKELGDRYGVEHRQEVYDREDWLDKKLATVRPRHQREAVDVLKWLLKSERHDGRDELDAILLNLVGGDTDNG
ncbi:helix-turn-helix domain-containing protein [Citrobacter freundii]|uniref:helix-turn-helix domain-containing protein n=1 Tax=Citrobacter freundii TaxID=546 RepID=UPI00155E3537|nr:helix-turn-helix domain-containing protein [Citrobacter freundii]WBM50152.1 helix-turn-helix domain-containing protein [Citrobacter freundii]WHW82910.1 helix-turn-helix domain-containing protein [Citrobacter freundii]WHW92426.1 helix-turn-helix domain-containing protein [Citrobacter freundii]